MQNQHSTQPSGLIPLYMGEHYSYILRKCWIKISIKSSWKLRDQRRKLLLSCSSAKKQSKVANAFAKAKASEFSQKREMKMKEELEGLFVATRKQHESPRLASPYRLKNYGTKSKSEQLIK